MNIIRFDINYREYSTIVTPIIDERSLISILKDIELPFAKKEGYIYLAGAYMGLTTDEIFPPIEYFLGNIKESIDAKTVLLDCECGNPGCWEFVANIEVGRKTVKWKDLEQPNRKDWNYLELGSLTFEKRQYISALKELNKYWSKK